MEPIARSAWLPAAYGKIFNIGADIPFTVNHLAHHVTAAMGVPMHPIEYLPERNEVRIAFSDHSSANAIFGPKKNTTLEIGLAHMVKWVRKVGSRSTPKFKNIEIEKNMPPSWMS